MIPHGLSPDSVLGRLLARKQAPRPSGKVPPRIWRKMQARELAKAKAVARRRAKNRVARHSRRVNRQRAR